MITKQEIHTTEDADGNITIQKQETIIKKEKEPDYIKLYTKVWCEFNQIPDTYRLLFLELIQRMSYCNSHDLANSQIVYTGAPVSTAIMQTLGWKRAMYQRGLQKLCECNAITKINRGVYQINPNYAGRGGWKYNPKEDRGGVKDLVAKFNFATKEVETEIIWADDGENDDINEMYRNGLGVSKDDETILSYTTVKSENDKSA